MLNMKEDMALIRTEHPATLVAGHKVTMHTNVKTF